jgi:D-glycero-D-manno-heptose 1,7-bisphosphate phosphatase
MTDVIMVMGAPASGKSTLTKKYIEHGYVNLNRDTEGGTIADLLPKMEELLKNNNKIVLDNLFSKIETRKPFIELAKKYNKIIDCVIMNTSIEDSQFNAIQRMIDITGDFPSLEDIKKSKHPSIFPIVVLFKYKKDFEKPTVSEGFSKVEVIKFERKKNSEFINKAVFLDFDGTLRECVGGNGKFPTDESHIEVKENRKEVIEKYRSLGYKILGVSNQSGVAKGDLTYDKCCDLFKHTNKLLGTEVEFYFCPHQSAPPVCYCRKPQVGIFVKLMNKYKLDPSQCIMVGDFTSDETFAKRSGMQYFDQAEFFKIDN